MSTVSEIPTKQGRPFSESCSWNFMTYYLQFKWNIPAQCWVLDISDNTTGAPILMGVALVTGCDVLEQFGYLEVAANAAMEVLTSGPFVSPDTVPNFTNLGVDGHVYVLTP